VDTVLQTLADFSASLRAEDCPPSVTNKARALLLYGVAVGVSSAASTVHARVASALEAEYGRGGGSATCMFNAGRMAPGAAAFANGVLLHIRIQDDAHPAGHMGTIILPAALALAETRGDTGSELLAAIISGYEVSLRIGRDHAADLSARGFRTTPIYGALGAAAACSRLLKLDGRSTMHALALATHAVSGLREFADAGTDEYPYQAGYAARNGMTAALLASEGNVGTGTALTGRAGVFRAYGDPAKDYGSRVVAELGKHYEIETVTYKPYPGGQFHRGINRGFAALRETAGDGAFELAQIHMHPFEANYLGLAYHGPYSTYTQAFFSAPFCAALAWLHGTVTFAGLNRFDDPNVLNLIPRVQVVADPARPRYKPLIRVRLEKDRILEWEDDAGESTYNLDWGVAVDMTCSLFAEAGLPNEKARDLIDATTSIGEPGGVARLVEVAASIASAVARSSR